MVPLKFFPLTFRSLQLQGCAYSFCGGRRSLLQPGCHHYGWVHPTSQLTQHIIGHSNCPTINTDPVHINTYQYPVSQFQACPRCGLLHCIRINGRQNIFITRVARKLSQWTSMTFARLSHGRIAKIHDLYTDIFPQFMQTSQKECKFTWGGQVF